MTTTNDELLEGESGDLHLDSVEEENIHEGVQKVYDLIHHSEPLESPIDIHLPNTHKLDLPELKWHHITLPPKKVKCTNTGHTLIVSAKWLQERPYLSGGPFLGNYVFSQLHFHWGANDMEGSEHTVSGCRHPLEMHAVFFKSCYLTQESALKKKDGMSVIAYFFRLQDEPNPGIRLLTDAIYNIRDPHSSTRLFTYPLNVFLTEFFNDYFLYVGTVNTATCIHYILWLLCREPIGISHDQMEIFRSLLDTNMAPLVRNFRDVQPTSDRPIFHVNPSKNLYSTLLLPTRIQNDMKLSQRPQQVNKYPKSSREYIGPTIFRTEIPPIGDRNYGIQFRANKTSFNKSNDDPQFTEKTKPKEMYKYKKP